MNSLISHKGKEMSKQNNFFIEFESQPDTYKNPFNQQPIPRKLESQNDTIRVSNCLVTITMHKDGRFEVEPNTRNIDQNLLLSRVV
jgi:hypothetical protein